MKIYEKVVPNIKKLSGRAGARAWDQGRDMGQWDNGARTWDNGTGAGTWDIGTGAGTWDIGQLGPLKDDFLDNFFAKKNGVGLDRIG